MAALLLFPRTSYLVLVTLRSLLYFHRPSIKSIFLHLSSSSDIRCNLSLGSISNRVATLSLFPNVRRLPVVFFSPILCLTPPCCPAADTRSTSPPYAPNILMHTIARRSRHCPPDRAAPPSRLKRIAAHTIASPLRFYLHSPSSSPQLRHLLPRSPPPSPFALWPPPPPSPPVISAGLSRSSRPSHPPPRHLASSSLAARPSSAWLVSGRGGKTMEAENGKEKDRMRHGKRARRDLGGKRRNGWWCYVKARRAGYFFSLSLAQLLHLWLLVVTPHVSFAVVHLLWLVVAVLTALRLLFPRYHNIPEPRHR